MVQIIISLLVISGIGALLALLLEIAHSYIANYGDCHITINEEKDLVVKGGRSVFFSLLDEGIFIPSACGGRGTCSYCKVKIPEGAGPVLPTETPYLNDKELADNVRLSCQVKVRNDIKVVLPEELFLVKEYKVRLADIQDVTPAIKEVTFDILSPKEGITFKPGQYIQLQVPGYELHKEPDFRAFSLASPSDVHDHIKLYITKSPEGFVSIYVHEYMKDQEELVMRGPFGDFYYRDSDRDILLIATGSGLAPIRSILHHIERNNIQRKTTLFFGARTKADLLHYDEIKELEKTLYDFTYVPILSHPGDSDNWDGKTGLITELIINDLPENPNIQAYICGAPIVVELSDKELKKKGLTQDYIFYDKFA